MESVYPFYITSFVEKVGWSMVVSIQLDFRSNGRSNSNFDCRNGFLGVDYICLDTSHDQIENFSKIVRGGQLPQGGVRPPLF